jgi:hypothetical protein
MQLPKFNWGTGIFLFYTVFAGSLFFQVYQSTRYDHSLVVEDYYAQDLDYQNTYEKKQHSLSLAQPVTATLSTGKEWLSIQFPEAIGSVSGEVLLYRPSSRQLDVNMPLIFDPEASLTALIPVGKLTKGRWLAKISWQADGIDYLDEVTLDL